ncbi:tetraacyldisaccharide 4'-kinase [Desertivirga brevis]|uniref:tetraacyldisaccharide 4'-kinase n=1 Tax=Desertivirga brevis TaxID=2810310 RepID=UPI001A96BCB8|nr:tetraacyldisaccharide 4'-kinase [Pedobacter sp. SYSU D00873]
MHYLRLLLYPFSIIYGAIVFVRNKAYDTGIFKSKRYPIPVICIGNLAVGGAGKSPMAEYIIRLLKNERRLAVLSRGYGRKSRGFRFVEEGDLPEFSGDEPLQFKRKFKDITIAVSEKRVIGIDILAPNHDVIILDDAFQHRAVDAGINLLLFEYSRLNEPFIVFPAGNLREPFAGRKRAQVIVITKTPSTLTMQERERVIERIRPFNHQKVFFSFLDYGNLIPVFDRTESLALGELCSETVIYLLSGIANPRPLVGKLESIFRNIKHHEYPDHHPFSIKNITKLVDDFNSGAGTKKIIITTEKDAQRLHAPGLKELLNNFPVYYLPVAARIHPPDADRFDNLIKEYVS